MAYSPVELVQPLWRSDPGRSQQILALSGMRRWPSWSFHHDNAGEPLTVSALRHTDSLPRRDDYGDAGESVAAREARIGQRSRCWGTAVNIETMGSLRCPLLAGETACVCALAWEEQTVGRVAQD